MRADGVSQCEERVYVRDTYRYSGRGSGGFSLHYTRRQCTRQAQPESDYCWQHHHTAPNDQDARSTPRGEKGN